MMLLVGERGGDGGKGDMMCGGICLIWVKKTLAVGSRCRVREVPSGYSRGLIGLLVCASRLVGCLVN